MSRTVVVTGMGVVSPAGIGLVPFWDRLTGGRSVVAPISRFDASSYPTRIAAAVDDSALPPGEPGYDRITRFALAAADAAVADSRLEAAAGLARERLAVVVATGMGPYGHREVFAACAAAGGGGGIDWTAFHET